tara:strand:+ start:945 stop:1796 length:852 start_codon:yes stop_codon:yes gene_type:complete
MGIFKNITKVLKKAAPLIGSTIGFAIGGPAGAAIGSGIGSLAGGRDLDDALRNAALAYGIGSLGQAAGFTKAPSSATGISKFLPGRVTQAAGETGLSVAPNFGIGAVDKVPMTSMLKESANPIFSFIGKNPGTAATIGIGALGLGGLGEEEKNTGNKMPNYPVGRTRLGTGRIGNKLYNLDDPDERRQYFEDNRKRQGAEDIESKEERDRFIDVVNPGIENLFAAAGGEVKGPGTGTSDSVPARLSDGEFVVTAKAVRGAGGGDRNIGAARMYDMMSNLERVA